MAESQDLRRLFARATELATQFREGIAARPPYPQLIGAALQARFDAPTPEQGQDPLAVLEALNAAADPGLTASTGPRFFGWVIGASDPAGVAADFLTSAWGQNAGAAGCSPAAAMAEQVAAKWLLDLLHLPPECSVGFSTGATMASFVCLAAARNAVLARAGWDVETLGLQGGPRVRVIVGDDVHTTILAGLRYLGLGSRPTRIRTDDQGRMLPDALAAELDHGGEGATPTIVIAQAGQICTGAFDPFAPIAAACRRHGAWLHVDGAFGLWAMAVPALAPLTAGCAEADSWTVDGHKWLQLPYDSGFAIVRDAAAHQRAMSITASYLPKAQDYDPGQFVPELSRRARGFAAWAQIRALGRDGIVEMVSRHCTLARRAARLLADEPGVRVLNEVHLNQVIVGFGGRTREVIERLRAADVALAGGAEWRGEWVLRLSIIASPLTEADIDRLVGAIIKAWREVRPAL
jgi:glutamate/tyrosine decarboxylase-like PLP-dependent enzyme